MTNETGGLDFSATKPDGPTLKRLGFTFVLGYLKPPPNSKELDAGHLAAYLAAGLEVGMVWETTATRALSGTTGGHEDGVAALQRAAAVGYPRGCVIFTAVDFNPTAAQLPTVLAYVDAFADVVGAGGYPPGAYGGLATVEAAHARRPSLYLWQAAAWSGGKLSAHAHLYQRAKATNWPAVAGTDEDVRCLPLPLAGSIVTPPPPTPAPTPAPGFDVRSWRAAYGHPDAHLPSLRRWADRVFPAYRSTPMDEGSTTNYGPQLVAFVREFGSRVGVPNDGRDIGPKISAALYAQGFRG